MSEYIETGLTLDSLDLIQIETLIKARMKELQEFKAESTGWIPKALADEQLTNYRSTLKKVKAGRAEIKRIADENHETFMAQLRNGRKPRTRTTRAKKAAS